MDGRRIGGRQMRLRQCRRDPTRAEAQDVEILGASDLPNDIEGSLSRSLTVAQFRIFPRITPHQHKALDALRYSKLDQRSPRREIQ
jgi:hypothetical protein